MPAEIQPLYTATATAHGGRDGHVKASVGPLDLPVTMPKQMGGTGETGTNPEQLFAAGYAACFESALRMVARMQKAPLQDVHMTASVTIGKTTAGGFGLAVHLTGKFEGLDQEAGQKLMEAAHQVCPYSNATRGNVEVKLTAE